MLDKDFKQLEHKAKGFAITHTGSELTKGYKPDVVMKSDNDQFIILESEHGSSRKHFIGGMIKAARFLTGDRYGILVFVIQIKPNTTEEQIANHLIEYFEWIKELTNLDKIYVISDFNYCGKNKPLKLLGQEFIKAAQIVL